MADQSQNFWDFSLQLYAEKDVAPACLKLQEQYDLDINLLLLCFWHGRFYEALEQQAFEEVLEFSYNWKKEVVQPLRDIRRRMKLHPHFDDKQHRENLRKLREKIKADELEAEKYQQQTLEQLVIDGSNSNTTQSESKRVQKNLQKLWTSYLIETEIFNNKQLAIIFSAFTQLDNKSR